MAIELQETQWAEQMIRSHSMGKKPSETLRRVARYYIDLGCSTGETRKKLEDFIQQCEPGASIPKWDRMLTFAVKRAEKNTAINIDRIVITDREMARIDALDGTQLRRLAFTLVCLAKYRQEVSKDFDGWVSTPDSAIMAMANVNTSIRRQSQLYRALREQGMIQFSRRVDNINVRVLFMEEGEPALSVSDFRNLGYQYQKFKGGPYFGCEACGLVTRMRNPDNKRRQKYCPDCAQKIRMQQNIDAVMRHRGSGNFAC